MPKLDLEVEFIRSKFETRRPGALQARHLENALLDQVLSTPAFRECLTSDGGLGLEKKSLLLTLVAQCFLMSPSMEIESPTTTPTQALRQKPVTHVQEALPKCNASALATSLP